MTILRMSLSLHRLCIAGVGVWALLLGLAPLAAQPLLFEVKTAEGNARVERSVKKEWIPVEAGTKLGDNDIVETFFQTRVVMQIDSTKVLVLGSNSKCLLGLSRRRIDGRAVVDLDLTVFTGGVFVRGVSGLHTRIYTSNAVAEMDSGAVSTVAEEKSGETGFQLLEGTLSVRNVAQLDAKTLSAGQTSIVYPRKDPSSPTAITTRHVNVLKHFFGNEYIANRLAAVGIAPTEDAITDAPRLRLSENLFSRRDAQKKADDGVYKPVFSKQFIYGKLWEDMQRHVPGVQPIPEPTILSSNHVELGAFGGATVAGGDAYPAFYLQPRTQLGAASAGLRLGVMKTAERLGLPQVSSLQGALDFVDFAQIGLHPLLTDDSIWISTRTLSNVTMGGGAVMNRFSMSNPYSVFHPLGLDVRGSFRILQARGVIADLSQFDVGGVFAAVSPGQSTVGTGYYVDRDQYVSLNYRRGARFPGLDRVAGADTMLSRVHTWELFAKSDVIDGERVVAGVSIDYAMKFRNRTTLVSDGFVLRGPYVYYSIHGLDIGMGIQMETGKAMMNQFHADYAQSRTRLLDSGVVALQNQLVLPTHFAMGGVIDVKACPRRGIYIDGSGSIEVASHHWVPAYSYDTVYTPVTGSPADTDTTINRTMTKDYHRDPCQYSFSLSITINDSLLHPIKYARLYARQGLGYVGPKGVAPTLWGFSAGLDVMTIPLFLNVAIQGGVRFQILDIVTTDGSPGYNGVYDPGDWVLDAYLGLRWGFL